MKILVATDGSEESHRILRPAARLAGAGGQMTFLQVVDPSDAASGDPDAVERELRAALDAKGIVGSIAVIVSDRKDVAAVIADYSHEMSADVIAVASRGKGRLRKALLGGVTTAILGRSPLPVLVAGINMRDIPADPADEAYHVLAATDGSESANAAITEMQRLAEGTQPVRVTLLRAYSPISDPELDAEDRAKLADELRLLAEGLPGAFTVAVEIRRVAPAERLESAIVTAAEELGADAIWMGTRGHSMRARVLAGSTALGTVERATVPVIMVPV